MLVVTGGGGFIGSNLVAFLEKSYPDPIVVCDVFDSSNKWRNLNHRRIYDIIPPQELLDFLEDHKNTLPTIFHLGAISTTTERDVEKVLESNLRFSKRLLQWSIINGARLIYASSAATYGDGSRGFNDNSDLNSLLQLQPLNPYAWSKSLFDLTIKQIQEGIVKGTTLPPQVVGLKFFNVYGPNEYHKGAQMSLVPQFFQQIQETGAVKLFKSILPDYQDGGQMRDFIYVDDCVKVMLWFNENPTVSGIFNVGTGKARTFNDLAKAVFAGMGIEPNITYIDMPDSLKSQYQSFTEAKIERLRQAGYTLPFLSLEEGARIYVQDYLLKPDPYR